MSPPVRDLVMTLRLRCQLRIRRRHLVVASPNRRTRYSGLRHGCADASKDAVIAAFDRASDSLVVDTDGVDHPAWRTYSTLLGMKGTLSEAETSHLAHSRRR